MDASNSIPGTKFIVNTLPTQRSVSSDPFLWSNFVSNRSSLSNPSEVRPNIPERSYPSKKASEGIHAKKQPMLPTLPEESYPASNPHSGVLENGFLSVRTNDGNSIEDTDPKTLLGSFNEATNELSSSTASAISLMVSNVRKTKNDFLAKELESRKELLQALVKDKNDTPV